MKKAFTGFVIVSAVIYILVLYYMLFQGFGRGIEMVMMSENMRYNYLNSINFIPFKTIFEYITAIADGSIRGHAIRNLFGNLFLLFPFGFYLPFFSRKASKIKIYIIVIAVFIVIIEIAQVLTMTGSMDIDDFILNFIGAMAGFIVFTRTHLHAIISKFALYRQKEEIL
jgi:glycopeptide antibiotics resistance protein